MNRLTIAVFLLGLMMMNIVNASSNAQKGKNVRSQSKRSCAAYGERCESTEDCCGYETDHCIGCFPRLNLLVTQFGSTRCGCQSTSNMVIDHPEFGRCNGYDRQARQCRHRYD